MPVEFGRYTLHEKVGAGGMAEVYRATTGGAGGFEKQFAIKRILGHHAEDGEFINMFMDEARIAAVLNHPNIAQVFEFDELDGVYYLAMEYVSGRNLSQVLRRAKDGGRPFGGDLATHVAMEVCKGLYAAHGARDSRGRRMKIIHRDISPQNVQISFAGDVKILDFGVAKARDKIIKTEAGTIRGKLMYMAPEQVRAQAMDHRADLFSLGLVLYKALTGVHPFEGESEAQVVEKIRKVTIAPPSSLVGGLPPGLDEVVMRSLAVDPADRYADAAKMHAELARVHHVASPGFTFSALGEYMRGLFRDELGVADLDLVSGSTPQASWSPSVASSPPPPVGGGHPTMELAPPPPPPPSFASGASQAPPAPSSPPPPPAAEPVPALRAPPTEVLAREDLPLPPPRPEGKGKTHPGRRGPWVGRWGILGTSIVAAATLGVFAAVTLSGDEADERAVRSAFGSLSVATAPPGAEVHLDGRLLKNELGRPLVTPAEVERLLPGEHILRLHIPGYQAWEGSVRVQGATRLPVSRHLALTPGRLKVTSTPSGAAVVMDGQARGRTPLVLEGVDRGRVHGLRLELTGRVPWVDKLSLEEEEVEVHVRLDPTGSPPTGASSARPVKAGGASRGRGRAAFRPVDDTAGEGARASGTLSLNSIPSARIYLDGRDTRMTTPAVGIRLSAGRHAVRLHNPELSLTRELDVVIRAGEAHTRRVDFRKAP